jgi:hypothetical protein
MSVLPAVILVGTRLLTAPTAAEPSPLPRCERGTRHLELTAEGSGGAPEVCIHPGLTTTLVFDTKLARMDLAGPGRFRVADLGTESLTLQSREARRLCWFTLIDVFRGQEWSEEARAAMRTTVVPELRRRLSGPSAPAVPEGSDDLSNEELLKNLDSMAHEDRGGRQEPLGE